MQNFLVKFDELADIKIENNLIRWLERAAFALMILMFAAAPHSIAVTNIGWLAGMFFWFVRLFFKPRPPLVRTPLDVPLWAFFGWSFLSSIFSYEPLVSLDKLRLNVILFLIFYFVVNVARTKRAVVFFAVVMIGSAMVSVAWTPIERIIGRGVQISNLSGDSPLAKVILLEGDTLLKANNRKIKSPEDLVEEIQKNDSTDLYVYRPDFYFTVKVSRTALLPGANAVEQLGIGDWKASRNWRSAGFYGHYTTFAEVLQLIASLVFGLFIASLRRRKDDATMRQRDDETNEQADELTILSNDKNGARKNFPLSQRLNVSSSLLFFCLAAMSFALLLTVTRASQLGFLISAAAIVLLFGSRRTVLILAAIALPVALIGLVVLQQSRQVGFFDREDESITWRQTVYREAFNLWTQNPHHFLLGVGMDSAKKRAAEWRLFDDGKLPSGHFHSTPLQIAVERGLPALLLWLWILYIYARTLLRFLNQKSVAWQMRGIVLGSFGGMIGFSAAGMVHYNLGDAEVAMVFFMLMGLSVALTNNFLIASNQGVFSQKSA